MNPYDNWYENFIKRYININLDDVDTTKLRLILGIGRSGTSWLNKIFGQTSYNIRCFNEPLYQVKPDIYLSKTEDRLAIGYRYELDSCHPLIVGYKTCLSNYRWNSLTKTKISVNNTKILQNSPNWNHCLVKEVHSLMATEAVIRYFQCPTVLVLRDPVYVLDSIFKTNGLNTVYLNREYDLLNIYNLNFLSYEQINYLKSFYLQNYRKDIIIKKLLTVMTIQKMFKTFEKIYPYVYISQYEETCRNPEESFKNIAEFLGFEWTDRCSKILQRHCSVQSTKKYDIHRISYQQLDKPFKVFTSEEVNTCREVEKKFLNL